MSAAVRLLSTTGCDHSPVLQNPRIYMPNIKALIKTGISQPVSITGQLVKLAAKSAGGVGSEGFHI